MLGVFMRNTITCAGSFQGAHYDARKSLCLLYYALIASSPDAYTALCLFPVCSEHALVSLQQAPGAHKKLSVFAPCGSELTLVPLQRAPVAYKALSAFAPFSSEHALVPLQ
eukprot:scaffold66160_cov19-Tisochrysis_lutea.AAC.1